MFGGEAAVMIAGVFGAPLSVGTETGGEEEAVAVGPTALSVTAGWL
jgi:hypothetical protein